MKFSEIVQKLDVPSHSLISNSDLDPEITGLAPIDNAPTGTLSYIEGGKFAPMVNKTTASALILPPNEQLQEQAIE
ncbi:MAG: LpxD N-terminal domain-containing protein, partial [Phormidium sp.]